jgi:adenylate kinase
MNFKRIVSGFLLLLGIFCASTSLVADDAPSAQNPLILILLGPPGSGKGTQAALLQDKYELPHISTGGLLRDHVTRGTDIGKKAKKYMDSGKLVPDQIILDMLFDRIYQKDCLEGYILDGFPRTLAQAEAIQARLPKVKNVFAVNLMLSDNQIIERLGQRINCTHCGITYHLTYAPPKEKEKCDKCKGKLTQRDDDKEEVIKKRLKVYHEETSPVIQFYSQRQFLQTIYCDKPKEKIFDEIAQFLPK